MLFDSTERNVNPLLFQTGIRTVKKLVLALNVHDQHVTMIKPARTGFTMQARLALPFEKRTGTKAHRHIELRLPTLPKQGLIIAVGAYTRVPFVVKAQVCGTMTSSGCDSPPQSGKQPQWTDSCALPVRVREKTRRKC